MGIVEIAVIAQAITKLLKPIIQEMLDDPSATKKDVVEKLQGLQGTVSKMLDGRAPDLERVIQSSDVSKIRKGTSNRISLNVAKRVLPVRDAGEDRLALKAPDRRFSLARTYIRGEPGCAVIVESSRGPAYEAATAFASALSQRFEVLTIGEAFTGGQVGQIKPPHHPGIQSGCSICERGGWAGTLGAFVRVTTARTGRAAPGFTSAAHVLEVHDEDKPWVYSPGRPDDLVYLKSKVGSVVNHSVLSH